MVNNIRNQPNPDMVNNTDIHHFSNGIKVYKRHLIQRQIDRYSKINIHEPEEEELFIEVLKTIDPSDGTFINIGAAIGYYVILAKKALPMLNVHAFEPLEKHRGYMKENLSLNNISLDRVFIHQEAISSSCGISKFCQNDYGSSLVSELHLKIPDPPPDRQELVKTITLDEFIRTLGKTIDLIQLDVQGFEFDVISGATIASQTNRIKTWLVGTHEQVIHSACLDLLTKYGYSIRFDKYETEHQPDGIILATKN